MTHDQLVAAITQHLGSEPVLERVIECEDLFKGCLALLADKAVHVEDRLGALVVKGTYAYADGSDARVSDDFSGKKEVRVRIAGSEVRLAKVLADDALELVRRFGGQAGEEATPVRASVEDPVRARDEAPVLVPNDSRPVSSGAPVHASQDVTVRARNEPQPGSRETSRKEARRKQRAGAFSFKEPALEAAKVAGLASVLAWVSSLLFVVPLPFLVSTALHSLVAWVGYAMLGAVGYKQLARLKILRTYGLYAAVISVGFTLLYQVLHTHFTLFQVVLPWATLGIGAFKARHAKATQAQAMLVGGGAGLAIHWFVHPMFSGVYLSVFASVWLFWFVQYLAERHPDSPVR